jgi:hypothetical protein
MLMSMIRKIVNNVSYLLPAQTLQVLGQYSKLLSYVIQSPMLHLKNSFSCKVEMAEQLTAIERQQKVNRPIGIEPYGTNI